MRSFIKWTPEEDAILRENPHLTAEELAELLPNRTPGSVKQRSVFHGIPIQGFNPKTQIKWDPADDEVLMQNPLASVLDLQELLPKYSQAKIRGRRYYLKQRGDMERIPNILTEDMAEARRRRPPTEETAYQIRIEYEQKREMGYTHDEAVKWVEEANDRDTDIVIDLLTNPKYDAQVWECKRRRSLAENESIDISDADEFDVLLQRVQAQKAALKQKHKGRTVVGTNLETGERVVFANARAAAAQGFNYQSISNCLRNKQKSHKGFKWERI